MKFFNFFFNNSEAKDLIETIFELWVTLFWDLDLLYVKIFLAGLPGLYEGVVNLTDWMVGCSARIQDQKIKDQEINHFVVFI